jgi:hypothetical protein
MAGCVTSSLPCDMPFLIRPTHRSRNAKGVRPSFNPILISRPQNREIDEQHEQRLRTCANVRLLK